MFYHQHMFHYLSNFLLWAEWCYFVRCLKWHWELFIYSQFIVFFSCPLHNRAGPQTKKIQWDLLWAEMKPRNIISNSLSKILKALLILYCSIPFRIILTVSLTFKNSSAKFCAQWCRLCTAWIRLYFSSAAFSFLLLFNHSVNRQTVLMFWTSK